VTLSNHSKFSNIHTGKRNSYMMKVPVSAHWQKQVAEVHKRLAGCQWFPFVPQTRSYGEMSAGRCLGRDPPERSYPKKEVLNDGSWLCESDLEGYSPHQKAAMKRQLADPDATQGTFTCIQCAFSQKQADMVVPGTCPECGMSGMTLTLPW
jgi:hypothetical protein